MRDVFLAVVLACGLAGCTQNVVYHEHDDGPAPAVAVEGGAVDVEVFHERLAPYGQWVVVREYGRCFVPAGVAADWRPYSVGHWAYTDFGWTWVSDEPFGWATYHYGRWAFVPTYGWVWLPGRVWGPAWVAWRHGGGYVGWAALPPTRGFEFSASVGEGEAAGIAAASFCFVDERYMVDRDVRHKCAPVTHNKTIVTQTTNITKIVQVNKKVVNQGVAVREVEKSAGRKIETVSVSHAAMPEHAVGRSEKAVPVYRPSAKPAAKPGPAQKPSVAYTADRDRLAQAHAKEKRELSMRQTKELAHPPAGATAAQLRQRHQEATKAVEQRQQKEVRELDVKHGRATRAD